MENKEKFVFEHFAIPNDKGGVAFASTGAIKHLDNGYYEVNFTANGYKGKFYINENCDLNNLSFLSYNKGSMGDGGKTDIYNQMRGDNPLQFDVVYVADVTTDAYSAQALIGEYLNDYLGGKVSNATFYGWSGGVGYAFENTVNFVENLAEDNPNVKINMVGIDALISGGSNKAVGAGITPESDRQKLNGRYADAIALLKKYDVHFYTVGEELLFRGGDGHALATILSEYGLNATEIAIENTDKVGSGVGHPVLFSLSLTKGLLPVLAGLGVLTAEQIANLSVNAKGLENYAWHIYANGDRENSEIDINDFLANIGLFNGKSITLIPDLTINSSLLSALNESGHDNIRSNLETVENHLNGIRGVLNGMAPFNSLGGISTVLITIEECISAYSNVMNIYKDSLALETAAILSHAEGIAAMDADLGDLVQRSLSDYYNGTNLADEVATNKDENMVGTDSDAVTDVGESDQVISMDGVPDYVNDIYWHLKGENDGDKLYNYLVGQGFNEVGALSMLGCLNSDEFKSYCEENSYGTDIYGQLQFMEDMRIKGKFNNSGTKQNSSPSNVGVNFAKNILDITDSEKQVEMSQIAFDAYNKGKEKK